MGKKAPDAPDYTPIAQAYEKMADMFHGLQSEQLDWAKEQNEADRQILKQVLDVQLPMMREEAEQASMLRDRYNEVFLPLEDELIESYTQYADEGFQNRMAEEAVQDVNNQFDAQRVQALQRLEGYGIDPSQTRSQALDLGVRTQQAAAAALAANQARDRARNQGLALQGDVVNLGRGVPSQVGASAGTSLNAGNSGLGGALNTTNTFMGALGNPGAWADRQMGAVGGQLNTMNSQWNANLGAWKAEQSSPGIAGGLGSLAGLALSPLPGGDFGGTFLGAGLGAIGMAEGGPVPDELSPSNGMIEDDVPARLTPGEYVIPDDVVRYKGEEFFEKLIGKTRERGIPTERDQQGAQMLAQGGPVQGRQRLPGPVQSVGGQRRALATGPGVKPPPIQPVQLLERQGMLPRAGDRSDRNPGFMPVNVPQGTSGDNQGGIAGALGKARSTMTANQDNASAGRRALPTPSAGAMSRSSGLAARAAGGGLPY